MSDFSVSLSVIFDCLLKLGNEFLYPFFAESEFPVERQHGGEISKGEGVASYLLVVHFLSGFAGEGHVISLQSIRCPQVPQYVLGFGFPHTGQSSSSSLSNMLCPLSGFFGICFSRASTASSIASFPALERAGCSPFSIFIALSADILRSARDENLLLMLCIPQ